MKRHYPFITPLVVFFFLFMSFQLSAFAQAEVESNGDFATANTLTHGVQRSGTLCPNGDADFFKAIAPTDGMMRIYIEKTSTEGGYGGFYITGFDDRKGSGEIFTREVGNYYQSTVGETNKDSIDLYCRAAGDIIYLRLSQSHHCYSYKLSFKVIDKVPGNDAEPNNTFEQATLINPGQTVSGHVGYVTGVNRDVADHYKIVTPTPGTVRVYVTGIKTGSGYGALYNSGYDARKSNGHLFTREVVNYYHFQDNAIVDSVDLFCRAASDTFYFNISSDLNCFAYTVRYKVLNGPPDSDQEPNNSFSQAIPFSHTDTVKGFVNYIRGGVIDDDIDYYRTILPKDGRFRLYVERRNTGAGYGDFYVQAFNNQKENGNFYSRSIGSYYDVSGTTILDSADVVCRGAGDTIYLRTAATGNGFVYRMYYKVLSDDPDVDMEPNNSFAEAVSFTEGVVKKGHLGYYNGNNIDGNDFYKTVLPSNGTMRVYLKRKNNSAGYGEFYVSYYDARKEYGHWGTKSIGSYYDVSGSTILDSVDIACRAIGDTFYFQLSSNGGCFAYEISYKMLTVPVVGDTEPNASFAQANTLAEKQQAIGMLGSYRGGVRDDEDFFKTVVPANGTLRVYIEREKIGGPSYGDFSVNGYDGRKEYGHLFTRYVGNYYDTNVGVLTDSIDLHCRAAGDTIYLQLTGGSTCYAYKLSYKMILGANGSATDPEGNNTFETATVFKAKDTVKAFVGYSVAGVSDEEDYLKTKLPHKGTVRVYVQATQTAGGGSGDFSFTAYDRVKAQFFTKNIAAAAGAGVTIFDTLDLYCQVADTLYFKVNRLNTCFSYQVRYEVTLGADTTVHNCGGCTIDISKLYNVKPFPVVKYENMASPGPAIDPVTVSGGGTFRLSVYNGKDECSRDTAMITVTTGQVIVFDSIPNKVFGAPPFVVKATATSGLPVTYSIFNGPATIKKDTVTVNGVGTVTVRAEQAGNSSVNYAVADRTFTVNKAPATVVLSNKSKVYDGKATTPTATTNPPSLPVNYTFNGNAAVPVNAGLYNVVATINSTNYTGSVTDTFRIHKAPQTINLVPTPDMGYSTATYGLSASATSGLPVSFSITTSPAGIATISGSIITMQGTGTVYVKANQAGNENYFVAAAVADTFVITKGNQFVSFSSISDKYIGDFVKLNATASTSLPITYTMVTTPATGVAKLSKDTIYLNGTLGSVSVTASQAGNDYYNSVQTQRTFSVVGRPQTITFGAIANKIFGDAPFKMTASASSGLPVAFRVVSGPATINGDMVTLTGDGTVTIEALQEGSSQYSAATPVLQNFTVTRRYPDFVVSNVASASTTLGLNDSATVSWSIANTGTLSAAANWTERLYMQASTGSNRTLIRTINYAAPDSLRVNNTVARTARVSIPAPLVIGDNGTFVVEVVPAPGIEAPGVQANNIGVQATSWTVKKQLSLDLSTAEITEGSTAGTVATISRTGSITGALTVNLQFTNAARFSFPATITIPAGQAAQNVTITAANNPAVEGAKVDSLRVAAAGFTGAKANLTIQDDDKPTLTVTLLPLEATEGQTVAFRVNTDMTLAQPLSVFLSSNNTRFPLPSSVTIPAGSKTADVSVTLAQNTIPEIDVQVGIIAAAANHQAANASLKLKDDDLPGLELVVQTTTISEAAGLYATKATLRRTANSNPVAFTANLAATPGNTLLLPATITLAQGQNEKTFDIGVVDNTLADGNRLAAITASIYVSSCGCSAPSTSSGTVSVSLTVTDNDGPALTLTAGSLTLLEGLSNAGSLRITRNSATGNALVVSLTSSNTGEATVPATATIPAGQSFVEVPITTVNDNVADGNKQVYFHASAAGFSQGSVWVMVSDQNKPDLQIPVVKLGNQTAQALSVFHYEAHILNSGFATAPAGVLVRSYLSLDSKIDETDSLLAEDVLTEAVPAGGTRQVVNAVRLPNKPGTYNVLYQVNPELAVTELLATNNLSAPVILTILPDFTATAVVANAWYLKGATIPVTGTATRSNGAAAANEKVEVYILTNGLRRTVTATTNAAGQFTTQFVPLANEAGHYSVGAGYPGLGATAAQDNFDILGVKINDGVVPQFKVTIKDTVKGTLPVQNLSNTALTKFSLVPVALPGGATLRFDTVAQLSGGATINLGYTVIGGTLSPGNNFEVATFTAASQQGTIQPARVFYFCQAQNGYLESNLSSILVTTSASAEEKVVQFQLVNKGRGATGEVTVELPQVAWLSSVTPKKLASMAPGDTAMVVLKFLALPEVPFNYPIKSSIVISSQQGNTISLPFTFEKVAQSTGTVKVTVTNQFTYFSSSAPKVKGAHVLIKNYYTGEVYGEGTTDNEGVLTAAAVPEGTHRLVVQKEKHLDYNGTITVNPGRTIESTVFLNYQAVTFNWSVVPTAVQDQYDITLETKFETNVPMPVVTIDIPKQMPQLSGSEVYAFNAVLTNHGLITANEVQLGLPNDDPEYEFVTNYVPANLLARQSIDVPVIMRRRASGGGSSGGVSVAAVSQFLGMSESQYGAAAAASSGGGNCQGFTSVAYWYTCNTKTGLFEKGGALFSYSGRRCDSPAPPYTGVPIDVGGGSGGGGDDGYNDVPCATCGPGGKLLVPSPFPPTPNEKKNCKDCIDEIKGAMGCAGPPSIGDAGKCVAGNVIKGAEWADYIECIPVKLPPQVACLLALNKVADKCSGIGTSGKNTPMARMAQLATTSSLGAAFDRIAVSLKMVERSILVTQAWVREYYGEMTESDALSHFTAAIQTPVATLDSIKQSKQDSILAAMAGYEIQPAAIRAFFTRWNTSIHARRQGVLAPNATYPTIINWTKAKAYSDSIVLLHRQAVDRGFESVDEMYWKEYKSLNDFIDQEQNAVCASVTMQLSQRLTMTREAFEGTLDIFNGHPSEQMDSVTIAIRITDANGVPANHLFDIQTKSLTNLANVTGTGAIGAQQKGAVKFLFIPTKNAAPAVPAVYNFGGAITYWDPYAGGMVTMPLSAIPLTVNPSPDLMLHYFMERNILGDDALTKEIEPSKPGELAVMVENQGYGAAVNMTISSAQPKITENEKGLAIEFNLVGSNFQGQPKKMGVTDINFGTVPGLQARVGQWYFTSSLLGKFVSYDAKVVHSNSFGNPDLSLVKGVKLHELTKSIKLYGTGDDGINDFLVNDNFDLKDVPDVIYHSQGMRTSKVVEAAAGSFNAAVVPSLFTNTLSVTASAKGWNYVKVDDPGNKLYDIASVTRSDGQVIPLNNAWLTFVTLPLGQAPTYENKFHFVDTFATVSPVTYTVVWKPRSTDVPKVDTIVGVPKSVTATQVQNVKVVFNKRIAPGTFTYHDMTLNVQGGPNVMNNSVVITQEDTATFNVFLGNLTNGNGFYVLTVQAAEVTDIYGINGETGKQVSWTQSLNAPIVQSFLGLPESLVAPSYDKVQVLFNMPMDITTVTGTKFSVRRNNVTQAGTITIDSVRTDHKLFYLSGLKNLLTQSGTYELVADLPNMKSATNMAGLQAASLVLTVDNAGPLIVSLEKSNLGGLDPQHVPFVNICFNEGVAGFNTASLVLKRNNEVQPLTYEKLSMADARNWTAGNFGMLTYPDGAYSLSVNLGGIKDSSGNSGTGTKLVSWVVDRTSLVSITGLGITPDRGFSAADGITSEQNVTVNFMLGRDASHLTIYQYDLSGETVLATRTGVAAGAVSIPVALSAITNSGIRVAAVGATGGVGQAEKSLFLDQEALTGKWKFDQGQAITRQVDTIAIGLSGKLLSNTGFTGALSLKRNGTALPTGTLSFRAVNDTLYEVNGLRGAGTAVGAYELTIDLQKLQKYTSGKTGSTLATVAWSVSSTNREPVARAGGDTTINRFGLVTLNGAGSSDPDGDVITYRWIAPQGVVLSDTTAAKPTFTVTTADQGKTFAFLLLVSDGSLFSTDRVNVTILSCSQEVCNGFDDDCDGLIDEDFEQILYYRDSDGDGFGKSTDTIRAAVCYAPENYAVYGGDCDDADAGLYPGSDGDGCHTCTTEAITFFSGKGGSYQWQVNDGTGYKNVQDNAVYTGSASRYLFLKQPPSTWSGYKYRCVMVTNGIQSLSPERVLKFTYTWKGLISNAWENAANWSCNKVPDEHSDVKVGAGAPLILSTPAKVRSMKTLPGSNFTIRQAGSLEVKK